MKYQQRSYLFHLMVATILAMAFPAGSLAFDADAAQSLSKKSNCFKCHAIDKKKEGPPYKEISAKYKGKPDSEQKLFMHLTTNPKVKVDGKEEEHTVLKSKKEADIRNVAQWILSM